MKLLGKILVSMVTIIVTIISSVILIGIFLFLLAIASICFSDESAPLHSVTKEVFSGCYVEHIDSDCQSIYYYPTGNEKDGKAYIVEEWNEVIKFASDNKEIIAFHCIYNAKKDAFVVYNTSTQEERQFKTQQAFLDYCNEKNLVLSEWVPGGCLEYEVIELGNGWRVYDSEHNEEDKILNGYGVVYEGYVEDIILKNNGIAEFIFAIPDGIKKEVPTSNEKLNVSKKVVGTYKLNLLAETDVCYCEKLSLNTKTGEVSVLEDD